MILEQLQIYQFEARSSSSIAGVPGFAEGSARAGDTLPLLALLEREFGELRASLGPKLTGNPGPKPELSNYRNDSLLNHIGSRK